MQRGIFKAKVFFFHIFPTKSATKNITDMKVGSNEEFFPLNLSIDKQQNVPLTSRPQPDQSDAKQQRKTRSPWFNGSTSAARVPPFVFERIGGDGEFSLLPSRHRQTRRRWNEVHRSLRREFSHYCGEYMMEIKYCTVYTHMKRIYWSY